MATVWLKICKSRFFSKIMEVVVEDDAIWYNELQFQKQDGSGSGLSCIIPDKRRRK